MRVLVGCEFSGVVRDAFIAEGHDAMSCDLLPSEAPGPHYTGDLFDVIDDCWDLAIFHPPCTHLATSGSRYFSEKRMDGRQQAAMSFVMKIIRRSSHIPSTAIENPVSVISGFYRKPDQIIQPWMFGHGECKATCFWLKGLPVLEPTDVVDGRRERIMELSPSEDRWKNRSRTLPGIAKAMSTQWGDEAWCLR